MLQIKVKEKNILAQTKPIKILKGRNSEFLETHI